MLTLWRHDLVTSVLPGTCLVAHQSTSPLKVHLAQRSVWRISYVAKSTNGMGYYLLCLRLPHINFMPLILPLPMDWWAMTLLMSDHSQYPSAVGTPGDHHKNKTNTNLHYQNTSKWVPTQSVCLTCETCCSGNPFTRQSVLSVWECSQDMCFLDPANNTTQQLLSTEAPTPATIVRALKPIDMQYGMDLAQHKGALS